MNIPFVDLKAQYNSIKSEIDTALFSVIDAANFVGGEQVKNFEKIFAAACGVKYCIGVGNGTDSIYIILKALGIGQGDEVITVSNSWISTSETISQTGARPVFVDIDPDYYTIDISKIEEKITDRTKAIIPVHLYGQMAQIKQLNEICIKHKLFLIEDCAQSHLAELEGAIAGTTGIAASFSFYPGKNLGAYGDAGAIITNDYELERKMRMYANHGALIKHQHEIEGINSRLDSIQAAILNAKLPHLQGWNNKRLQNALYYHECLKGIKEIATPKIMKNAKHVFHLYVIRAERRSELISHLNQAGIQTAIHYPIILPLLQAYKHLEHKAEDFPVSSGYQNSILSLPMFPELCKEQIEHIAVKISDFYSK